MLARPKIAGVHLCRSAIRELVARTPCLQAAGIVHTTPGLVKVVVDGSQTCHHVTVVGSEYSISTGGTCTDI